MNVGTAMRELGAAIGNAGNDEADASYLAMSPASSSPGSSDVGMFRTQIRRYLTGS